MVAHITRGMIDPSTNMLMTEAVYLNPCGHIFNESTILGKKVCPLDGESIKSYAPDPHIRGLAQNAKKLDPLVLEAEIKASLSKPFEDIASIYKKALLHYDHGQYEVAAWLFKKVAREDYIHGMFSLGVCYLEGLGVSKNVSSAFKIFEQMAQEGYSAAEWHVGNAYQKGLAVPINFERAFEWYEKAAEHGLPRGQCAVGESFYKGRGVAQNDEEAFEWFKKAADQDYHGGQCGLGHCYYYGHGVQRNIEEGVAWYLKAAKQGNIYAQFALGGHFQLDYHHFGMAFDFFKEAALLGHAEAQYELSRCYFHGWGTDKDEELGFTWLQKSAMQGQAEALYGLGLFYDQGIFVEKSYETAFKLFDRASDAGCIEATYQMGRYYYKGRFVPQNHERAKAYYRQAQKYPPAEAKLMKMEENSFQKVKRASEQGSIEAIYQLGLRYYRGSIAVQRNLHIALQCFKEALDKGHLPAAQMIQKTERKLLTSESRKKVPDHSSG